MVEEGLVQGLSPAQTSTSAALEYESSAPENWRSHSAPGQMNQRGNETSTITEVATDAANAKTVIEACLVTASNSGSLP
eukprot:CAMPEP_0117495396 /NCGR_PEP_ID=MMETSP0784-20121206/20109_1 /TAXON_ID=39447 /ORGANISM="" /LENGTH=78 /DNA_ID=CAMNT_0005290313 /DNA_START=50 /DNA_END=286 /DNA_ORIENTATION=+